MGLWLYTYIRIQRHHEYVAYKKTPHRSKTTSWIFAASLIRALRRPTPQRQRRARIRERSDRDSSIYIYIYYICVYLYIDLKRRHSVTNLTKKDLWNQCSWSCFNGHSTFHLMELLFLNCRETSSGTLILEKYLSHACQGIYR